MPTQLPFSPLFCAYIASNSISIVYTRTRRCTATVIHLPSSPPPHFLALLRRLSSPRTAPSLAACLPSSPFFRFSPPSVLTPDSSSFAPLLPFCLTGWTAARSEPQRGSAAQKACAPLGAKVMLGGHIVLDEQEVCAERQYDPSLDSSNSRDKSS